MRDGERTLAPLAGVDFIRRALASAGAAESIRNKKHDKTFTRARSAKTHDSVLDRMSVARQCIGTGSKFGHQRIGKRRVARRGIGEFSNGSLLLGVMENDSQ